ncbi:hypothetical protein EHS13_13660 [Paenibacillus psychroresistens]|uniref:Uncharacterized protein n=1 Tax=Paenibacillus psychroresistens TaxID=1778678 RepID=A0A6B8RIF4_9BACL|nr:hypothetical protein [Paenibacillus psychroresistens]QGQ95849.1 hypothetical protein EHS13_13660 [Paenibacillus psychroresistens]
MDELKYYIAYKGRRFGNPMTKEAAIIELFKMSNAFNGMSIHVYDFNDKLRKVIARKKPPNEL